MYFSVTACHLVLPFPPYTHSLPLSDGRASFLFSYSSTLQLSTCLLQPPRRSLRFFLPHIHVFLTFSASVLPICLFSMHTTLYKMSRNFSLNTKGWCAAAPNPNRNISLTKSSMSLYQSAILTPSTSTSVCKTRPYAFPP